jgi:cell division protein FtsQ
MFSMVYLNFFHASENVICRRVEVEIANIPGQNYISASDVISWMKTAKVFPVGKNMNEISASEIEAKLNINKLIKRAECFKTIGGYVKIKVYQRIPVLRVFSKNGSYYVDKERNIMPVPRNFAAYVPIACGNISDEYAKNQLYDFAIYLQKDKFWDSQIAQIYVTARQDIVLTPVVGDHSIILGKVEACKENLDKLQTFYEKGLNKIGWNRYSTINLKYKNQVVCTLTCAALMHKASDLTE